MSSLKKRCEWVGDDSIYIEYHDNEWGRPVYDDKVLFEFLILEGAQAGLNWLTILKRRESYRRVFHGFDPEKVANMSDDEIAIALKDGGIIRNNLKVHSAVRNAKVFLTIQKEFGSFSEYLWSFVNKAPIVGNYKDINEVPVTTKVSDKISNDLKKRGMNFVGSTIIYAYMQAVGLVNDHTSGCYLSPQDKLLD